MPGDNVKLHANSPSLIPFFFTRETHFQEDRPQGPGFWEGLRIAFRNRAFVLVLLIHLLSWLSVQFVQANLILYVKYWMKAESQFGILVLAVQVSGFLFIFCTILAGPRTVMPRFLPIILSIRAPLNLS